MTRVQYPPTTAHLASVVVDLQRPVRVHSLGDVEDGGHHVALHVVEVAGQEGAARVLPDPVDAGPRQPQLVPDPVLGHRAQLLKHSVLGRLLKIKKPEALAMELVNLNFKKDGTLFLYMRQVAANDWT